MKSFCLKTNNDNILDYLLEKIQEIDFQDLIYCKNRFKNYKNVIIHYKGKNETEYKEFLKEVILDIILNFYEDKIIRRMIAFNYFYFESYEREQILDHCFEIMQKDEFNPMDKREEIIKRNIDKYLEEKNTMVLDGFITFRLQEYFSYLDNVIDISVNKYIVEKEYNEFIDLLKAYVDSSTSKNDIVHLIYKNNEGILLDKNKNLIDISENLLKNNFLSDITFSTNDYILNTLLTISPKKIEIHIIDEEDEFIDTLKLIFRSRVSICRDCNICKTYKMLKNVNVKN